MNTPLRSLSTLRDARGLILGLGILLLLTTGCPPPTTYYVHGAYTGIEVGTEAQPFRTIAAGLGHASSGDTVVVASGLYREHVTLPAGVSLVSPRVGAAVIHGGADRDGGHPTVTMANGAELRGFTITGGYDGIKCDGTSGLITRNVIIANYGDGGIVCLDGCTAEIRNNTILGNLGSSYNPRPNGIYAERATPTIVNNIITGNHTGYAPYQCTPAESYNDIWGNRRDYGYDASGGTGTIAADPLFAYTTHNANTQGNDGDYRLAAGSPCRDAGHPDAAYNDADGTRADIGAFDGDGGHAWSQPAQEYFVESVLSALDLPTGPRIDGTSRFTADPVFWFDATGRGTQGETDTRAMLTATVPDLTHGLYSATFLESADPPADRCRVVTVTFDTPRGVAFRQGVDAACNDAGHALERAGAPIIGGELHLSSAWTTGYAADAQAYDTAIHELGHVAGLAHAFRGNRVIGYEGMGGTYSAYTPIETEAIELLYGNPAGTTLDALITSDDIARAVLHPFPILDSLHRAIVTPGWPWQETTSAVMGDTLLLEGSRLTLRWSNEGSASVRPPDYAAPVVYFGNTAVTVDLTNQASVQGAPSRYLQVEVPAGLDLGWTLVYVQNRGLESNPLYLEITG